MLIQAINFKENILIWKKPNEVYINLSLCPAVYRICTWYLQAMLVETIHSAGLSLVVFVLLPNMDPVAGAMFGMNVAILPTLLSLIYQGNFRIITIIIE